MVEHPNLTALMFALLPRTLGLAVENQGAQVLLGQGVPAGYIPVIREQLESAVHGVLRFSFDTPLFDQVPADYPTLARVVTESQAIPSEERLDLIVGVILDGIELHLTRWRADPPTDTPAGRQIGRVELRGERLPGYDHHFNPIEMVWGNIKTVDQANLCPDTIDEAHAVAEADPNRVGADYDLCFAFLAHTGLSL
jgi:hypothetical protein